MAKTSVLVDREVRRPSVSDHLLSARVRGRSRVTDATWRTGRLVRGEEHVP
jgi:hypothetical protein